MQFFYQNQAAAQVRPKTIVFLGALGILCWFVALYLDSDRRPGSPWVGSEAQELIVYCAAGIRKPVAEAAKAFEEEYGVVVRLDYGSSGELEGKLELERAQNAPRCDLYIPADLSFSQRAREKGLIAEHLTLASFQLVLAMGSDEELPTQSLSSLATSGQDMVSATKKQEPDKRPAKLSRPLVYGNQRKLLQELLFHVSPTGRSHPQFRRDPGWLHLGFNRPSIRPENHSHPRTGKYSIHHFRKCLRTVQKSNLGTSPGPLLISCRQRSRFFCQTPLQPCKWRPVVPLTIHYLLLRGVNREAISPSIKAFEQREGCVVETQLAGCGTLIGSIRSGPEFLPDLFMTCDASYLSMVADDFLQPRDVSSTRVCMLVRKGNPNGIRQLSDLEQADLKIGTTDPAMSTLGALSHAMFEDLGIASSLRKQQSIIVTTPTAHELILQMEGHDKLDVALVYEANCQHLGDHLEIIPIDHPLARATQNMASGKPQPILS